MQLKDYAIPRSRISLPGVKDAEGNRPYFEVRGLTLDDLTFLIGNHLDPITRALAMYQESRADILVTGNVANFMMTLMRDFPDLASEVISAATDSIDDETRKIARQLPAATQISALSEIVKLSVEDAGGLKNLLAEMQTKVQSLAESVASVSASARPKSN